jgi:hypothetical protein
MPRLALVGGVAFACVLGGVGLFWSSPWSQAEVVGSLGPILIGATVGFAFGYVGAEHLRLAWAVWLLSLAGVGALVWWTIQRCLATTPGDDCGIAGLLFFAWLVPWSIGVALLLGLTVAQGRTRRTD